MSNLVELKPCPFCGETPSLRKSNQPEYDVFCGGCGVKTLSRKSKQHAIDGWNRRTP
jgi:Lar family restriction alleviation protein